MKTIRRFFHRLKSLFWLPVEFKKLRMQQEIQKRILMLVLGSVNRKVRRKFQRVMTNPRSPFYVGNIPA